jgi:hypothetical protein
MIPLELTPAERYAMSQISEREAEEIILAFDYYHRDTVQRAEQALVGYAKLAARELSHDTQTGDMP